MDIVSTYHMLIERALFDSGLTDKMMHVHVGMAIFLCAQILLRTRRGSIDALLIVIAAESFNEIMDRLFCGSWQIWDTTGDVASTLFWPTMIVLVSRYRRWRWTELHQRARAARQMMGLVSRGAEARPSSGPAAPIGGYNR